VDLYFENPIIRFQIPQDGKIDPLFITRWWCNNQAEYPIMSQVARDYLAIPASEVDLERLFSSGHDMISVCHHSLKPETMRALVLLKGINIEEES